MKLLHMLDVDGNGLPAVIMALEHFEWYQSMGYELAVEAEEKQTALLLEESPILLGEIS